jgi:bile acid:Na+ symporter, BASS family
VNKNLLFYLIAFILSICYLYFFFVGNSSYSGWLLMMFFLSLAVAFRSSPILKGYSFTLSIFAAVSLAMYYPSFFLKIGDWRLSGLIVPLLQIIMFGMGTELNVQEFKTVLKQPRGVLIGIVCHYTIMPFLGFALANIFKFPNEIAAGIILVGCCPSGLASNVMSYLARANLALSISVTTVSTILAPVFTPFLIKMLGGELIEIHFWAMVWDISKIVILPISAGLLFHHFLRGQFSVIDRAMPKVSMFGIAFIIVIITAAGRDSLLVVGLKLILVTFIQNVMGYTLGYCSARILKLSEKDCRTISLEVGMQNGGVASGLALTMGKLASVGLAPAVFGPMMNITGSSLASFWHRRPPKDD